MTADTDRVRASSPLGPELAGVTEAELVVRLAILQDDPSVLDGVIGIQESRSDDPISGRSACDTSSRNHPPS